MVLETVILILQRAISFDNQYRNYFSNNLFLYQYMGFSVSLLTYYRTHIFEDILGLSFFLVLCSNEDTSKKLATDHAGNTF